MNFSIVQYGKNLTLLHLFLCFRTGARMSTAAISPQGSADVPETGMNFFADGLVPNEVVPDEWIHAPVSPHI
jgi:hypothetical protein